MLVKYQIKSSKFYILPIYFLQKRKDMTKHKPRLNNGINPKMLYDESEVAALLRVTIRTIANYRLTGKLPAKQVNCRKYLYLGENIQKLLIPIEEYHYDA